uniref:ShKT domain-containing protein n=1 Tax=Ditylenchus dipsaci TaxID=166011 RepID=A0A915D6H5_9BILA
MQQQQLVDAQYDVAPNNSQSDSTSNAAVNASSKPSKVSGEVHPEKAEENAYGNIAKPESAVLSVPLPTTPESPQAPASLQAVASATSEANKETKPASETYQTAADNAPVTAPTTAAVSMSIVQSNNIVDSPASIAAADSAAPVANISASSNVSAAVSEQHLPSANASIPQDQSSKGSSYETVPQSSAAASQEKAQSVPATSSESSAEKEVEETTDHSTLDLNKAETYGTLPPSSEPSSPAFSSSEAAATTVVVEVTTAAAASSSIAPLRSALGTVDSSAAKPISAGLSSPESLAYEVASVESSSPASAEITKPVEIVGIEQQAGAAVSSQVSVVQETTTSAATSLPNSQAAAATEGSNLTPAASQPEAAIYASSAVNGSAAASAADEPVKTSLEAIPAATTQAPVPVETTKTNSPTESKVEDKSDYSGNAAPSEQPKGVEVAVQASPAVSNASASAIPKLFRVQNKHQLHQRQPESTATEAAAAASNSVPASSEYSGSVGDDRPESKPSNKAVASSAEVVVETASTASTTTTAQLLQHAANKAVEALQPEQPASEQPATIVSPIVAEKTPYPSSVEQTTASDKPSASAPVLQTVSSITEQSSSAQPTELEKPVSSDQTASAVAEKPAVPAIPAELVAAQPTAPEKPAGVTVSDKAEEYASVSAAAVPDANSQHPASGSQAESQATSSTNESSAVPSPESTSLAATDSSASSPAIVANQPGADVLPQEEITSEQSDTKAPETYNSVESITATTVMPSSVELPAKPVGQVDVSAAPGSAKEAKASKGQETDSGPAIAVIPEAKSEQPSVNDTVNTAPQDTAGSDTNGGEVLDSSHLSPAPAAVEHVSTPAATNQGEGWKINQGNSYEKSPEGNSKAPIKPESSADASPPSQPIKPEEAVGYDGLTAAPASTNNTQSLDNNNLQQHDIVESPSNTKDSLLLNSLPIKRVDASTKQKWKPFEMNCSVETDERGPELCGEWARAGLCTSHRATMFLFCRKTCLCIGPQPDPAAEESSLSSTSSDTNESDDSKFARLKRRRHTKNRFLRLQRARL